MEYSILKGLGKSLKSVLAYATGFAITFAVISGWYDIDLWTLVEATFKPMLSGLTVGGLLMLIANYLKVANKG